MLLRIIKIDTTATDSITDVNHLSCSTIILRGGDELETGNAINGDENDAGEDLNVEEVCERAIVRKVKLQWMKEYDKYQYRSSKSSTPII